MGRGARSWFLATSALGMMVGGQAMAEEQRTASSEEIVVTAAGYEQRIMQAPASISVLGREEIEENRASSLAEVLAGVEGVDVGAAVGKTGGSPSIFAVWVATTR